MRSREQERLAHEECYLGYQRAWRMAEELREFAPAGIHVDAALRGSVATVMVWFELEVVDEGYAKAVIERVAGVVSPGAARAAQEMGGPMMARPDERVWTRGEKAVLVLCNGRQIPLTVVRKGRRNAAGRRWMWVREGAGEAYQVVEQHLKKAEET